MEVIRQLSPPSSFHLQRYKKIPKLPNFFATFFIFFPKNLHQPYPPTPADIVCPNTRRFPPISTDNVSAVTRRLPPFSAITRRLPPDFRRHPPITTRFPPSPADFRPISAVTRRFPPDNISAIIRRFPPDFRRRRVLPRVRPQHSICVECFRSAVPAVVGSYLV